MKSKFWSNDPKDHYRIFKDKTGRTVVKVVTPSGVVALISTDIPVTTIRALKERIKGRILRGSKLRANPRSPHQVRLEAVSVGCQDEAHPLIA